jgi:hypothetical protein
MTFLVSFIPFVVANLRNRGPERIRMKNWDKTLRQRGNSLGSPLSFPAAQKGCVVRTIPGAMLASLRLIVRELFWRLADLATAVHHTLTRLPPKLLPVPENKDEFQGKKRPMECCSLGPIPSQSLQLSFRTTLLPVRHKTDFELDRDTREYEKSGY